MGDWLSIQLVELVPRGTPKGVKALELAILFTCGVDIIGSSVMVSCIKLSSSEPLLEVSDIRTAFDPTDLGRKVLSAFMLPPHVQPDPSLGESSIIECDEVLLDDCINVFCVMVGEDSGEDCSGIVE